MDNIRITLSIDDPAEATLCLDDDVGVSLELGDAYIDGNLEPYTGDYEVTSVPWVDQVLPTAYKKMLSDMTVKQIPYSQTTNESGGYTVSIAS